MGLLSFAAFACSRPTHAVADLPLPVEDLAMKEGETERKAVFAAGCFWCVEAVFERLDGVSDVVSGYAGDTERSARYDLVSNGSTKHAEVVQVTYDPSKISYGRLLRVFFATHDPTTKDRQGPDRGAQYRSAVFYANEDERRVAEAYIRQLDEAKAFEKKIVTTLEPLDATGGFFQAEKYHQDFVQQNPTHPYVQAWVPDKIEKLKKLLDATEGEPAATQPATRPAE